MSKTSHIVPRLAATKNVAFICIQERVEEIIDQIPDNGQYNPQEMLTWIIDTYACAKRTAQRYLTKAINQWRARQTTLTLTERRRIYIERLDEIILDTTSHPRDIIKAISTACYLVKDLRVPLQKDVTVRGDEERPVIISHIQEMLLRPDVAAYAQELDNALARSDPNSHSPAAHPRIVLGRPADTAELDAADADVLDLLTAEPGE